MIIKSEAEWDDLGRRKAFAVAVLAEVWAGAELPESMIKHAEEIRAEMQADGTWMPA